MTNRYAHAAVPGMTNADNGSDGKTTSAALAQSGRHGGDIVALARRCARAAVRWHLYRQTARELGQLGDSALRDIGLSRREIEATAYTLADRYASARPLF